MFEPSLNAVRANDVVTVSVVRTGSLATANGGRMRSVVMANGVPVRIARRKVVVQNSHRAKEAADLTSAVQKVADRTASRRARESDAQTVSAGLMVSVVPVPGRVLDSSKSWTAIAMVASAATNSISFAKCSANSTGTTTVSLIPPNCLGRPVSQVSLAKETVGLTGAIADRWEIVDRNDDAPKANSHHVETVSAVRTLHARVTVDRLIVRVTANAVRKEIGLAMANDVRRPDDRIGPKVGLRAIAKKTAHATRTKKSNLLPECVIRRNSLVPPRRHRAVLFARPATVCSSRS